MKPLADRISTKPKFILRDSVKLYTDDWRVMIDMMDKIEPVAVYDMTDMIEVEFFYEKRD